MRRNISQILIYMLLLTTSVWSIPGDLDLNGTVDFDDFFVFADNFGKSGPPQPIDTIYVTLTDTLIVTVLDTVELQTVFDTLTYTFGHEPLVEVSDNYPRASVGRTGYIPNQKMLVEVVNTQANAIEATVRLTAYNSNGGVLFTSTSRAYLPVYITSGNTRIVEVFLESASDEALEALNAGDFQVELFWDEAEEGVTDTSLEIRTDTTVESPLQFSGVVENPTDNAVSEYTLGFYGLKDDVLIFHVENYDELGITAVGASPFLIDAGFFNNNRVTVDDIDEVFGYIKWRWTTDPWQSGGVILPYRESPVFRIR